MEVLFEEIYQKYYKDVYNLAFSYTLNNNDAEDIVQKVFMKLFKHMDKFNSSDINVKKWLFKVSANESKDLLKSFWKSKKSNYELEQIPDLKNNDSFIIFQILEDFDSKYRIPFYLHYYEGYTSKEIAKILKTYKNVVDTRLFRIKKMMKEKLGDEII